MAARTLPIGPLLLLLAVACSDPANEAPKDLPQDSDDTGTSSRPSGDTGDGSDIPTDDADRDGFPDTDDCDPDNPAINPEATDIVGDDIDQNCDGIDGTDMDGDGFPSAASGGSDCDDRDPAVSPAATDTVGDGIDNNCDGIDGIDFDGDGQASVTSGGLDCDDTSATVRSEDTDGDGWSTCGGDCDDADPTRSPDDLDGDGWSTCDDDCDDTAAGLHPFDSDGDGTEDRCGWMDVAAGHSHTCALDSDGVMWCWGDNSDGQATAKPGIWRAVAAHATSDTSCGLDAWDQVSCWGAGGTAGRLRNTPSDAFTEVTIGQDHACGLTTSGTAKCWGDNAMGEASAPAGSFVDVAPVDTQLSCGIDTTGAMECWGYWATITTSNPVPGTWDRLVPYESTRPAAIDTTGTPWSFSKACSSCSVQSTELNALYALDRFDGTCGIDSAGVLQCWATTAGVPTVPVRDYSGGAYHGCAILAESGALTCWGVNVDGQTSVPTVP